MSLFGKDDHKRLTDTLAFIDGIKGISQLPKASFLEKHKFNTQLSRKISLGFRLANDAAETERRRALRALLLCVGATKLTAVDPAKRFFAQTTKDDLTEAIKSYFPLAGSDASSVVKILQEKKFIPGMGSEAHRGAEFYKYTRGALMNGSVVGSGNCYGAACLFLYLGGVVSLRWLMEWGTQLAGPDPMKPFAFDLKITSPFVAQEIAPGKLLFYWRPPLGIHYTISIGDKNCVGHNNSMDAVLGWPKKEIDKDMCGIAPSTTCSTFRIAGYLRASQDALVAQRGNKNSAYLRVASCVPTDSF